MALEQGPSQALAPFLPQLRYFGDYELIEEIARGGMGVVYRARQVSLDRLVAVKMMRPGLLATEPEIQRFHAEAKTAARLQHPHIVAIHEVGEFDGLHYFSMDLVDGPSLARLVRERPISSAEAARYVQLLAETVHFAHSKGVLHRDLKPSNVLVDEAGRLRITDFGLARPLSGIAEAADGTVAGTPAYMPPEQAAGRQDQLSRASDVYSLGAILYELVTGLPPFRAASQKEMVRLVLEEKPAPPHELNAGVDRDLERICLRCLEKEPGARYESAADLAQALQRFLGSQPGETLPQTSRKWLRSWTLAAAAMVAVLLALGWMLLKPVRKVIFTSIPEPVAPAPRAGKLIQLKSQPAATAAAASPRRADAASVSPCVALASSSHRHSSQREIGSLEIRAPADCQWSIHTDNPWIAILSAARGSGNALVKYQVAPTDLRALRKGSLLIGGRKFLVEQEGLYPAPALLSVSPDHGVGYSQAFTFRYTSATSADSILGAEVDFHEQTAGGVRDCAVFIEPSDGRVQLQFSPQGGPGMRLSGILGSLARLDNAVCTVDLVDVAVTRQGNELEVRLPMTFKPAFEGLKEIRAWAWDRAPSGPPENGVSGQWTVGPPGEAH